MRLVRREGLPLRVRVVGLMAWLSCPSPSLAFPPYETTDAETAGTSAVEFRLGLLEIEKTGSDSERLAPLTNLNFGVGPHFEISSELAYAPDDDQLDDGALGFKWAAPRGTVSIGVETLALLPVQSDQSGAGLSSQFLVTAARERWQIHGNAGPFYDRRDDETERGWRASILAEFPRGKLRPGVELFVRDGDPHAPPRRPQRCGSRSRGKRVALVEVAARRSIRWPRMFLRDRGSRICLRDASNSSRRVDEHDRS